MALAGITETVHLQKEMKELYEITETCVFPRQSNWKLLRHFFMKLVYTIGLLQLVSIDACFGKNLIG